MVPELVARTGILLHYYADRSSHWYCADAPKSGVMLQPAVNKDYEYDLVIYTDDGACNFMLHADAHYWEQGMGISETYVAPGTLGALYQMYGALEEFAGMFRETHPEWFDAGVKPLDIQTAIGSQSAPGYLYNVVRYRKASKRVDMHITALKDAGLPPLPGWEKECNHQEVAELPIERFASAFVKQLRASPEDCASRALLKLMPSSEVESGQIHHLVTEVVKEFDFDGNGRLSRAEAEAWENDEKVTRAFEKCEPAIVHV